MPQRDQEPPRSSLPSLRSLVHVAQLSRSNAIRGRRIERRQTIDVPDPEPTLKRSNAIIRRRRCVSFDSPLSPTIPQQNALAEHLAQAEAPLGPQDARLQTVNTEHGHQHPLHTPVKPRFLTSYTQLLDLPFRPHRNAFVSELDGELAPTRTPPSYPTSPDHLSASASIQRSAQTTTVDWKEVRRLPRLLTTWSQEGKSTSRIGQLLHETAYGWDRSLGNLVTTMVDQGRAYHEIGHAVLRNLDLRNEHGDPLYRDVPRGDVSLTPGSILQLAFRYEPFGGNEQETRGGTGREDGKIYEDGTSPLSYEDPHTLGPRMVCPQPRPNQGRWPFFEDDESLDAFLEGAQDEDEEEWAREERSGSNLIPTPIRPPRARRPRYVVPDYIPVSCGASIVGRDSDEGE
ncbi:hypothetical protein BJX96DRAFT_174137 [Aspergillus floccosus]